MLSSFKRVLVVAPHPDDETLGVGGTIHRLVLQGADVCVAVMTGEGKGVHPLFPPESFRMVQQEFREAMKTLGVTQTRFTNLPTTLLTETPVHEINRAAALIVQDVQPDLIFLPFEHDLHRDHGIINYAFAVALRPHLPGRRGDHLVLNYETLSETHLQSPYSKASFEPQFWIDITSSIDVKLAALACFDSQVSPAPALRSLETVRSLASLRGAQIGVSAAEAFVVSRCVA
jgi:LmbE family N-acetylglucosaminyl deacetylase